eukprot:960131-Pyramimonas_sp.AAC.1
MPFDGVLRTEQASTTKAALAGRRSLGRALRQPLPRRLKRMLFLCSVYSAAISELSAFVLPEDFTDRLGSAIVKMSRGPMKGKAAIAAEGGRTRAMPPREARSFREISPTAVELQLQRVRWARAIVRDPANHEQVPMEVFGATTRRARQAPPFR